MSRLCSRPTINVGDHFGYWTVIYVPKLRHKVLCQCLRVSEANYYHLLARRTLGCALCRSAKFINGHAAHGKRSRERIIYDGMIQRCYNPKSDSWDLYGGCGIYVCERWRHSFDSFLADVGKCPSPQHSLDRFPDKNGPYRLPRRKREILYARALRALSMRPALSLTFTSNELIRHCFLRRQAEKLPPTLRRHEKHSCGFSFNPRILS
jgi:hypothetical protein